MKTMHRATICVLAFTLTLGLSGLVLAQNRAGVPPEIDYSKLSKDKFVARVQLLMHEARVFESQGQLKSAYELASRADSILATLYRYSKAELPADEETPAALIKRLRARARRIQQAQVLNRSQSNSASARLSVKTPTSPGDRNRQVAKPSRTSTKPQTQIAEEPRLLLEQLDRVDGNWEPIEEPTNSAKTTIKPPSSVINANIDPFVTDNQADDSSRRKTTSTVQEPSLLLSDDRGNRVAPIPTQVNDSSTSIKPTPSVAKKSDVFAPELLINAKDNGRIRENTKTPSPFVLDHSTGDSQPLLSTTGSMANRKPDSKNMIEPNESSDQTSHAHSDQMWLWISTGIALTLACVWLFRVLSQTLFGVQVKIDVRGKTVSAGAAAKQVVSPNSRDTIAANDSTSSVQDTASVSNSSMESFPFRLVGGGGGGATDTSEKDDVDNSASKQEMLRSAFEDNIALQSDERREAA
jgi:hypothetical protein